MQRFKEIKNCATKEGHYNIPCNYSENKQLLIRVTTQISQYRFLQEGKQSTMTEDKNIYWNLLDMFGRLVTNIRFHKSELEEEYVQALSSIRFEKTKNRSQYLQESKY